MNNLMKYGLSKEWLCKSEKFPDLILGRVIAAYSAERIDVMTDEGIVRRVKLHHMICGLVVTGDWVCIKCVDEDTCIVERLLERKNKFVRKKAGTINEEQIIGVNLDRIFIVTAVDGDFNPRRLERYIAQATHDHIATTIVLSKCDLTDNAKLYENLAKEIHPSGDVIKISSYQGPEGLKELVPYLKEGETIALVGSSGVGKSTIVNTLFGEEVHKVNKVNEKTSKGNHTTTNKALRAFEKGFLLLDTPGMREFGVITNDSNAPTGFADIEDWAKYCKYNNCQHKSEKNCAVKQAVKDGHISQKRLDNYLKITYEQYFLWVKGRRIHKKKLKYGNKK